jgi:hypothetical protein
VIAIEIGQTWVSRSDGSTIVVVGRSDLLAKWWKVRPTSLGPTRSIDAETLRALYDPQPVDAAPPVDIAIAGG